MTSTVVSSVGRKSKMLGRNHQERNIRHEWREILMLLWPLPMVQAWVFVLATLPEAYQRFNTMVLPTCCSVHPGRVFMRLINCWCRRRFVVLGWTTIVKTSSEDVSSFDSQTPPKETVQMRILLLQSVKQRKGRKRYWRTTKLAGCNDRDDVTRFKSHRWTCLVCYAYRLALIKVNEQTW